MTVRLMVESTMILPLFFSETRLTFRLLPLSEQLLVNMFFFSLILSVGRSEGCSVSAILDRYFMGHINLCLCGLVC